MRLHLFWLFALSAYCCTNSNNNRPSDKVLPVKLCAENTIEVSYAKGFTMEESDKGIYIVVDNPWKPGDTLATYFLPDKNSGREARRTSDFTIPVPVENIAVLSSTFLGMFRLLGEESRIRSATDARLIYDSILYRKYLDGKLTDLGEAVHLNVEAVVGQSPDLVMKYIFGTIDETDHKIKEAGIPIAYNLEYMESHPLGRAEWIKFVAAFTGKIHMADSIFRIIENEYLHLSELAKAKTNKPTVLDGSSYKGIWYAAGGKSYPARLYEDAGAEYFWKTDTSSGSIPVSFEVIIEKQSDADYWIGPSTGNRDELLQVESRYALLKAFRNGNVYYFGKRVNPNGGYDYYESGVVRPDILLQDMVWVFHRDLLDETYEPVYLEKIK